MTEIAVDNTKLSQVCRAYHVKSLAIFGSRSRGEETFDSELDLLVEFEPGMAPGLKFFRLERELSNLFHLKVDLNTAQFLSKYFRAEAMRSAKIIYAS